MTEQRRALLERLKLFPDFTTAELDALAGILVPKQLKKKTMLFKQGDPGNACYLVVKGRLRLWVMRDGKKEQLAILGVGELFGQMALLDGGARSASCGAVEDAVVLVLKRDDFDLLYRSGSSFAFKFVDMLTRVLVVQLRHANRRLLALADRQEKQRTSIVEERDELRKVARSTLSHKLDEIDRIEVVIPDGLRDD